MGRDIKGAIDTKGEYTALFILIGIIAFAGVIGGILYVFETPDLNDRVYQFTHEQPEFSGDRIVFQSQYEGVSSRESINKIYGDTDTEYGWCMRVEGDTVEGFQHFKGLNKTTPKQIRFSCNSFKHNGIMHTHPGVYGVTALSETDKESLKTVSWIDVSCVVGSMISSERDNPSGINCYEVVDGEIRSLDVVFKS